METQLTRDRTSKHRSPSRWQRPLVRASFTIGALALLIFLACALVVLWQLPLLRLDANIALFLKEYAARHGGVRVLRLISALADPGVLLLGAGGVAWLALCAGVWAAYRPARGVLQ